MIIEKIELYHYENKNSNYETKKPIELIISELVEKVNELIEINNNNCVILERTNNKHDTDNNIYPL